VYFPVYGDGKYTQRFPFKIKGIQLERTGATAVTERLLFRR